MRTIQARQGSEPLDLEHAACRPLDELPDELDRSACGDAQPLIALDVDDVADAGRDGC
jgi:hypothetical protein